MNYAQINNNIVKNIVWIDPKDELLFPDCIKTDDLPVMIGDTYNAESGKFYRNGVEVSLDMYSTQINEVETI